MNSHENALLTPKGREALMRAVAAAVFDYQKHRVKRLKNQSGP
jgi:hypothetical protein